MPLKKKCLSISWIDLKTVSEKFGKYQLGPADHSESWSLCYCKSNLGRGRITGDVQNGQLLAEIRGYRVMGDYSIQLRSSLVITAFCPRTITNSQLCRPKHCSNSSGSFHFISDMCWYKSYAVKTYCLVLVTCRTGLSVISQSNLNK